jgi:ribosomal protein S18 acetylase RimI-like enzyme
MPRSLYLHELQLLPQYQGCGLGAEVLRALLQEASDQALSVSLSVAGGNPRARHFYERHGFHVAGIDEPFVRMEHPGFPKNSI